MRGTIIILAKAPRAGAVKTRLAAGIGAGRAAALCRILIARTVDTARRAAAGSARVLLAIDPPSARAGWRNVFPPSIPRLAQGTGDLGARMARAICAAPPGPVLVIGVDAPGLRPRHLRCALGALRGADAVFGPAADGGFWLIGLARRRAAPRLFEGVRWSGPHALADTLASLPQGFDVAFLEVLDDIDEAGDLAAFGPRATAR